MTKINFVSLDPVSQETLAEHRDYSRGLGLPEIGSRPVTDRLAIVGGSPSVVNHIEELQNFDGEVWAINEAHEWCQNNGIVATFYCIDPTDTFEYLSTTTKAVLADIVAPSVFDDLIANDCDIELVRLDEIMHGSAAASSGPQIALRRGHKHVTMFGCAQSFTTSTHLYKDVSRHNQLWVECGGTEYRTTSQNVMQAELLAELATAFPSFITVKGEGFLPALIKHGDYDVSHVSRHIHDALFGEAA